MGNDRNAGKRDEKRASWRDNAICKNFLVWECPCDFFINESGRVAPKSPFGECSKQHSEAEKMRFKEDMDYRRCKHRYLQDLSDQLRKKIETMDKKVATVAEALIMKAETQKDNLEASGKLGADNTNNSDPVDANDGRARVKDAQDEICEVCGTYTAFTDALIMRHDAGLLHIGWGRLRESFANLQKEVKASKEGLTSDELIGPADGRERSSSQKRARRPEAGPDRDGRKDVDETRDRDRRREYEQKSRGRERDTHSERGRDKHDDRRPDARNRDRGDGRRQGDELGRGKPERSRKEKDVDEFGRGKTIHDGYRNGQHPIGGEDKRGRENRSRSRDAGKSTGSGFIHDTQDLKILQIEFSEDWQVVMNQKCADNKLAMSVWDMTTCLDRKDRILDLGAKDVGLSIDSFPLRFKFTKKA